MECSVPGIKPDHVSSVCQQMLDNALLRLQDNPGLMIRITGNANDSENYLVASKRASNVKKFLTNGGISAKRIIVETGDSADRTVELWLVPTL